MSWRKVKLGGLVDNFSVRAKDVGGADGLEFFGVSNEVGITKTKYAAEDKAEDYKIIEQYCFAYNPYRVNVGSIGMVTENIKGLISPAYVVFKPKPNSIKAELLLKFLKSNEGLRQIRFYARGTVRQALRFEDLCNIELSLPDYDEQEILIEKLNSVQVESDELKSELTHQENLLKQLRQSFLREAMQGKLVKQDKKDGNASELLKKIKAEKLKSGKKEKVLPPINGEEIPFDIPDNWVWCRLGEICDFITKGTTPDTNKITRTGDIPYLKVYNIVDQIIDFKYKPQFIDVFTHRKTLTRSIVYPGDVLMNIVGPPLGKVAIVPEVFDEWNINQALAIFRPINIEINKFLYYFLCEGSEIRKLIPLGVVGQDNLSLVQCRNIIFPLPPLAEQKRIVKKLEEVMNLCEELKTTIIDNQNYTDQLLQIAFKNALHPKKAIEIISTPTLPLEEKHFLKRKVLATYIINQSLADNHFGDVKFEKILHLSDYFAIKRNLGQKYYQQAAGPYDNAFTIPYFQQVVNSKWFNKSKHGNQFVFSAGQNHDKSTNTYNYFSTDELQRVNEIISYFKRYDYEQPEIVSTLYAVWNNRIIRQEKISDDLLIEDFYSWDKQKKKYEHSRLVKALEWMRNKNFVPDGWGNVIEKVKKSK